MTRFFIDRPIFSWVISIIILLGGAVAGFSLRVRRIRPGGIVNTPGPFLFT